MNIHGIIHRSLCLHKNCTTIVTTHLLFFFIVNVVALQRKSVRSVFLFNYDCSPAAILFWFRHSNAVRFDALQNVLRCLHKTTNKMKCFFLFFCLFVGFSGRDIRDMIQVLFTCEVESGSSMLSWLRTRPMPPSAIDIN